MGGGSEPWRLDKHIPIAVIFTIAVQTIGIGWFASDINTRVEQSEKANARQDALIDALRVDVQVKADRVAEAQRALSEQLVEQRADLRAIRDLMQRIETRLDQAQAPRRP